MKPIKLIFQAFGPYAGREEIDFLSLSSKGLYLIYGETGSGKTTQLDAMTFALYGKSSGNNRDDFYSMRCTKAAFDMDTIVSFEFENNGIRYLFERRLERKRKNLSPAYNASVMNEDGVWEPIFENAKSNALDAKAQEIIGLDYKQFRQVILLPQGQFEKLLTSNSDEKEQILATIFGEKRWSAIAAKMFDSAYAKLASLREKNTAIANSLSEEGCTRLTDLATLVADRETELKNLEDRLSAADFDKEFDRIQEQLTLAARFKDMHVLEAKAARLEAGKNGQEERKAKLALAAKAEPVREAIREADKADTEFAERTRAVNTLTNRVTEAETKATKATEALKTHQNKEKEIEGLNKQSIELADKRKNYAELENLKNAFLAKQKEYNAAETERKQVEAARDTQSVRSLKLQGEYENLRAKHADMLSAYMSSISGILAESLVEGSPCPVCGSTSHPKKAIKADEAVSQEAVDILKAEAEEKYAALQTSNATLANLAGELATATAKAKDLGEERSAAKTRYEGIQLVEGIADSAALERKISELEKTVAAYKTEGDRLTLNEKEAKEAVATAKANCKTANDEAARAELARNNARDVLDKVLKENGFGDRNEAVLAMLTPDKVTSLQEEISKYDADVANTKESLANIAKELTGVEEPDVHTLTDKKNELNAAKDKLNKDITVLKTVIDRLKEKYDNLTKRGEGLDEAINEAEEELAFARKLRGDTGVSLQRYVLGIMFSQVIAAANKMLELVHDGRYRLFRTDDKGGSGYKRGLELKVMDKYSEDAEGRFVNTLSGGEKFLVSLALSIGLSTVAQRSGIKIEALFIDEGFGSLDTNSIEDAMSVLDTVQKANGTVGIISHVQLLQERIPTKLLVTKSEGTSHISMSIG